MKTITFNSRDEAKTTIALDKICAVMREENNGLYGKTTVWLVGGASLVYNGENNECVYNDIRKAFDEEEE